MAASALFTAPAARAGQPAHQHLTDPVNPFGGTENEGAPAVTAPGTSDTDRHVGSARADGAAYERTHLTTDALRSFRSPRFTVGPQPSGWGTSAAAAPPPPELSTDTP
ncbi:hypothetical protein [Streptomyces sp. WG5]|uniref:hypothetical protein n=1 Tax=Streptomyces sp. WG5 TaxID=3417648 RepID=UPI003CFA7679